MTTAHEQAAWLDERMKEFTEKTQPLANLREISNTLRNQAYEIQRLQRILDGRPAINAGLPESYIEWSQGLYQSEMARAAGLDS